MCNATATATATNAAKAELEAYAAATMAEHGLTAQGWSFKWNHRKNSFGVCNYTRKTIQLSAYMLKCGESVESLKGTVVHEIAHALTPGAGHGTAWKEKMVELGQQPNARREAVGAKLTYKWSKSCPSCDFKVGYHKKTKAMERRRGSCPHCSGGKFNEAFELQWVKNH